MYIHAPGQVNRSTPTPQPKVKSTTIESTDQIQCKVYNFQVNSNTN